MQNNITEITQKLLGALDGNYNVTNMATIIEVITLLEKVTITKEMLETTRLGKHINELRKHISNDTLAKRAKLLVKKWRNIVLVTNPTPPDTTTTTTNGQIRAPAAIVAVHEENKKRPPPKQLEAPLLKKQRANGGMPLNNAFDYDFSDNSNSSFKDVPIVPTSKQQQQAVVIVNSDSNSSMPEYKSDHPLYEEQQPKKRGRKKGSKNHKNLIEEAESSFSNKMAVSRGNAKVKTTQELIESLQSRTTTATPTAPLTSPAKNVEDWRERAAKLTERVSLIDQKLNSGNRLKKQRNNNKEHGSMVTPPLKGGRADSPADDEDEIVVVDDVPSGKAKLQQHHFDMQLPEPNENYVPSLSIEEALGRLPPIDTSAMYAPAGGVGGDDEPCLCVLEEHGDVDDDVEELVEPKFLVHDDCPARIQLDDKYRLNDVGDDKVGQLHASCIENLNGNFAPGGDQRVRCEIIVGDETLMLLNDAGRNLQDVNIVPNFYELPPKRACSENYKKYSISERARAHIDDGHEAADDDDADDNNSNSNHSSCKDKPDIKDVLIDDSTTPLKTIDATIFREFHECLDRPSYNGDILRILPYVVID